MSLGELITTGRGDGGHTATVLNPDTDTDTYNNVVDDWTSPDTTTVRGWFAQTATDEELASRDAVIIDGVFYCKADAPITSRSRLVIDGVTYTVVGRPHAAPTPRGVHHLEVKLRAVTG